MRTRALAHHLAAGLLLAACLAQRVTADEPMSESADSLDFERFHQSAGQGRPLIERSGPRDETPGGGVNVFDSELDNPSGRGSVQTDDLGQPASGNGAHAARQNPAPGPPPAGGEVMNIRVRYTLTRSEHTPFLAHTAIHALHSYIVDHCPAGWLKLAEWVLPVGEDFYLYYQFRCVAH